MKNTIACYKWVADEADIRINPDLSIDFSKAQGKISNYDKHAIEAACRAAQALGGKAFGLSFGASEIQASFRDALARGLDEGIWVKAEEARYADGAVTAKALAAAVKKTEEVALVICAEGSSDNYARQIAPRLGAALDWPVVTSVGKFELAGHRLQAVRKMENHLEMVELNLPAVIAVLPEVNPAPIPGLKAVLTAKKKPVVEYGAGDIEVNLNPYGQEIESKGYVMDRKNIILSGDSSEDKIRALIDLLRKEGVL